MARSKKDILLSQRKYILDLLSETEVLKCRSIDSAMDVNMKLLVGQGKLFKDVGRYRRLVKKLNYMTVTRPDIIFAVSVVSQFLSALRTTHLEVVMKILWYLKKASWRRLLYSDHRHSRVAGFSMQTGQCPFDRRSTT